MMAKKKTTSKLSYKEMVAAAIAGIGGRKGASLAAIKKYIASNYKKLDFKPHLLRAALKNGCEKGNFAVHHTHRGSYKLGASAVGGPPPSERNTLPRRSTGDVSTVANMDDAGRAAIAALRPRAEREKLGEERSTSQWIWRSDTDPPNDFLNCLLYSRSDSRSDGPFLSFADFTPEYDPDFEEKWENAKQTLRDGSDPNSCWAGPIADGPPDCSFCSPLWVAAGYGRLDACLQLLNAGANVNIIKLDDGEPQYGYATPLAKARSSRTWVKKMKEVKELRKACVHAGLSSKGTKKALRARLVTNIENICKLLEAAGGLVGQAAVLEVIKEGYHAPPRSRARKMFEYATESYLNMNGAWLGFDDDFHKKVCSIFATDKDGTPLPESDVLWPDFLRGEYVESKDPEFTLMLMGETVQQQEELRALQDRVRELTSVDRIDVETGAVESVVPKRVDQQQPTSSKKGKSRLKRKKKVCGLQALATQEKTHGRVMKRMKLEKAAVEEDRDDEEDERKTAHAFIEKQKDDLDVLRRQIRELGQEPRA